MKADERKGEKFLLSYKPVFKYNLIFCILILLTFIVGGIYHSFEEMKWTSKTTMNAAKWQIEYRIKQSIRLLESCAAQEQYRDPSLLYMDKVNSLNQINRHFGYMMIRYVDQNINVYSARGATSLASREYMQRLFTTGKVQVTDSFAAGADGVTLNYTVAVPLYWNEKISGSIFCAIYFDEIQRLLVGASRRSGVEATMLGSRNQMMSVTDKLRYGNSYLDYLGNFRLFGNTKNKIEADLLGGKDGGFWAMHLPNLYYSVYSPVENTSWNIIVTTDFWSVYWSQLMGDMPAVIIFILSFVLFAWFVSRYMRSQRMTVDSLIQSVQMLERKLYLDKNPHSLDFNEVLQLTGKGLSDSLTGVVTRSVFVSQVNGRLKNLVGSEDVAAFCFIDLDDLKKLNDTYGHGAGDLALKNIGYILREYEKKFDGLTGRYGGDEFVMLLTGLKNVDELRRVLDELASRLHFPLAEFGEDVMVHCSIGVALYKSVAELDYLVSSADQALYYVKQHGKGTYHIYSKENFREV